MKTARLYEDNWRGQKVSEYGLQTGYIDYRCLAHIVGDMILNLEIIKFEFDSWEIENGSDYDEENDYYYDIYQYYIIDSNGADFLKEYTNEIVYYNEKLDIYLWAITHFGTSWDYVLTDIKIEENYKND